MQETGFTFERLDNKGVETLIDWAAAEGWNPGINDASLFYNTDKDGFYGYFKNGKLVGGGSIVNYNNEYGFMGFFIVRPEYRNMGIGAKLWRIRRDTLRQRLLPGAAIGMDGVSAMLPFYARGGFVKDFTDERYMFLGSEVAYSSRVSAILSGDMEMIHGYDTACFGFDRRKFIADWVFQSQAGAFKYIDNLKLKGYAVIRKARIGYKIGPLFADNPDIAEELFRCCLKFTSGQNVFLDITLSNIHAVLLTRKYSGTFMFECGRMYNGKAPILPIHKIFGITSFELG